MQNPTSPRIGHDLVHVPRFREVYERHAARFRARVFTAGEWKAVGRRSDHVAALAARFAAKEAAMKALGTGWGRGVTWRDVEVVGGGRRAPSLRLHGAAALRAKREGLVLAVSMSHDGDYASAVVIGWPITAAKLKAGAWAKPGRPRRSAKR